MASVNKIHSNFGLHSNLYTLYLIISQFHSTLSLNSIGDLASINQSSNKKDLYRFSWVQSLIVFQLIPVDILHLYRTWCLFSGGVCWSIIVIRNRRWIKHAIYPHIFVKSGLHEPFFLFNPHKKTTAVLVLMGCCSGCDAAPQYLLECYSGLLPVAPKDICDILCDYNRAVCCLSLSARVTETDLCLLRPSILVA